MDNWYYQTDDRIVGPMTRKELDYLATIGRVKPATMVRCGDTEVWQRMRPRKTAAVSKAATTAIKPVEATATEESSPPTSTAESQQPDPQRKIKAFPSDTSVRTQAIAGAILAIVFLLAFWLFRDYLPPMGSHGESNGQDMASNDGDPSTDNSATGQSSTDATSQAAAQPTETNTQPANAPVTPPTAAPGTAADQQTTATGGNNKPVSSGLAALNPANAAGTVQPGDPHSKFTIAAPGEATFFGLSAAGNNFVFVVDRSGSMAGAPLTRAKAELLKCVHRMPAHVNVLILFFDNDILVDPAGPGKLTAARLESMERWVNRVTTGSGTDPRVGMQHALTQSPPPDAVFLLTDGEFTNDTPAFIHHLNNNGSTIHTVALVSRAGESLLKQIADQNNGDYKFVP